MDFSELDRVLCHVYHDCTPLLGQGRLADYIPELARVDPRQLGLCLHMNDGTTYCYGDTEVPLSIQSISKVFVLAMVLPRIQPYFERVHVEPSGDPFNSLVQLEYENGLPRNPFINAGALVTTDMLMELEPDAKGALLRFLTRLNRGRAVTFNEQVAKSELDHAGRNRALAYFMQSFSNIRSSVEELMDVYCHQCAVQMSLRDLTASFAFLANGGLSPTTGEQVVSRGDSKRINALMLTCGFYDESGEFAYRVGLPGKSGVGGGIATVLPGRFTLSVWSPGLNSKGNSLVGMRALEMFTARTSASLF
ncbi:MAG TPA: glutaminase [Polyangiaceae bacterium]|jgi:glutaminase|nr:glutaminase [Polyangiaceae bacterium]